MMFSFDHEKFITPFITISNGQGTFLEFLEFTFVFSGDDIVELKWRTHYNDADERRGKAPTDFEVEFRWEAHEEMDIDFTLAAFFFLSFLLAFSMLLYVIIDSLTKGQFQSFTTMQQRSSQGFEILSPQSSVRALDTAAVISSPQTFAELSKQPPSTFEEISEEEVSKFVSNPNGNQQESSTEAIRPELSEQDSKKED